MTMTIRIGLPKSTGQLPNFVTELEQPALLSAGSLWDQDRQRFRSVGTALTDVDCALDSSGFVRAQAGGYPWQIQQYVELAGCWSFSWWAAMDKPCEPELARNARAVRQRQIECAHLLWGCLTQARLWREAGVFWLADPVPVLQGWSPEEYVRCAERYNRADLLGGKWPELVGVGSMCRRRVHGPQGVLAVVETLHRILPAHVGLHLFGVKGSALRHLRDHPRITSIDSQAWGTAARQEAHKEGVRCGNARKVAHIRRCQFSADKTRYPSD